MRSICFFSIILTLFFLPGCKDHKVDPIPPVVATDTVKQYGTPFAGVPDAKDVIMYEVNMRAYGPNGNFADVLAGLDSIKKLGINTIWLMPIYPVGIVRSVGGLGSPYSVRNYLEVNDEFGTRDDLRNLVAAAHSRGMAVILDWVANHTSWDNPWIQNKSWYTQDASGNIVIPAGTNWNDVADLNYDNTAMRQAMIAAMKYWVLMANIDGYRCDYADGVPEDFWKAAIDTLHAIPDRKLVMLAEGSRKDHFTAGFQFNYAWDYLTALTNVIKNGQPADNVATTNTTEETGLPSGTFKLRFTSNHDEDAYTNTPLGLFNGKEGSIAAYVATVFMGGVPLIYNGQEVGCDVMIPFFNRSPIDWTTNPDMKVTYRKLLTFRQTSEAVKQGSIETYNGTDVVAFKRVLGMEEVLVIINTRNQTLDYDLAPAIANTSWKDVMNGDATVDLETDISLPAYSYFILKN